jgi:hypothetical protein
MDAAYDLAKASALVKDLGRLSFSYDHGTNGVGTTEA